MDQVDVFELNFLTEPTLRAGCRCCGGSGLDEGVLNDVENEQREAKLAKLSVEAQPTAQKSMTTSKSEERTNEGNDGPGGVVP